MLGKTLFDAAASGFPSEAAARTWHRSLRAGLARVARMVALWASRSRERRALADLANAAEASPHLLRDIGASRAEAWRESEKPFWRP